MPNTLTNVKDIKVAQNALQPWMAGLLPLRAFSTNFSPEPADKLDTVRVPVVGAPSQSSEFAGSYTTTTLPLVMRAAKEAGLLAADVDLSKATDPQYLG